MRPDPLPLAARLRSNLVQAPVFLVATALFGSLSLLVSLWDKTGHLQHRLARQWARASVFASGARIEVTGIEHLTARGEGRGEPGTAEPQACVFACNHTSYMDTPVVFASLPQQFRILAKKELWKLPFIGWYLRRSGQIPIDTANPRASLASLAAAARTLKAGMPLFIFPEGGRTQTGGLQPFLNGAAYLAIKAQAPLVPIALIGVRDLLPIHTRHFYPGKEPIRLVVGAPIATAALTLRDADALTGQLEEAVRKMLAASY